MFFNKKKKTNDGMIYSPVDGKIISIEQVQDDVFSDKILGDGVAVIPQNGSLVSPVNGKIKDIADSLHAICIETVEGLELLIHVGLNTVEMKGKPFTSYVKNYDKVKVGYPLLDIDLDLISKAGYITETPILITNIDKLKKIEFITGDAVAGKTVIIKYDI